MVERIIVGVDGSGPSRAAIRWTVQYAAHTDANLVLEHVVDDEWGQLGGDYAARESRDGNRVLEEALDQARASGLNLRSILRHGSPAWTLIGDAKPGEMLVVGTHKTGFLRGRVLGTRSVVVASAAPCTVVVVPDDLSVHRRGVVVGVAPGDQSHAAILHGASEAQRRHEELTLLHVCADNENAESARAVLSLAAELASTIAPNLIIRRKMSHRRCSDALLDVSRMAALLVLGESRADVRRAGFIGTVTHEVILNLNSPVMIAR